LLGLFACFYFVSTLPILCFDPSFQSMPPHYDFEERGFSVPSLFTTIAIKLEAWSSGYLFSQEEMNESFYISYMYHREGGVIEYFPSIYCQDLF